MILLLDTNVILETWRPVPEPRVLPATTCRLSRQPMCGFLIHGRTSDVRGRFGAARV
ncbi:hypothetical protein SXCC_00233 [Gluconacetobacter sp. SXCC-1]|nr:hypothetical protein SXCC_00233 [Gluconacetobacter sp. SXCC-1]